MAVTEKTMRVAECDAPSCKVARVGKGDEPIEGYHVTIEAVGEDTGRTVSIFAHRPLCIGPAANAALRDWENHPPTGELEGPQVPDGSDGSDGSGEDEADDDTGFDGADVDEAGSADDDDALDEVGLDDADYVGTAAR